MGKAGWPITRVSSTPAPSVAGMPLMMRETALNARSSPDSGIFISLSPAPATEVATYNSNY
jgi:hypothetical protein